MSLSKEDKESIVQFCKEHNIACSIGWQNFTRSVDLPETLVLDIQKEEEAVELVQFIYKLNAERKAEDIISYRAVAAGQSSKKNSRYDLKSYSMTPCMEADILLQLRGPAFYEIKTLDKEAHTFRVGPSIQIGDLDKRLYQNHDSSLPTSTLIPWVTIGGSGTGTHGTGRNQPSVPGLIMSLRILRPDGKIVKIDRTHLDFETIRAAHLGLFGIVLDMDIQCRPASKLKVKIWTSNIFDYKEAIKKGLYENNEYVSVAYFADGEKDEGAKNADKDVVITTWNPVPLSTPDKGNCSTFEYMTQRFTIFMQEILRINTLLKRHPHLVPFFKKYLVAPIQTLGQNKTVVAPWYIPAHNQQAFPQDLDDEDDLFAVSPDNHEILEALDFMVATLNKYTREDLNPVLYAMYFRYFKGTNGGLSTSTHEPDQHVFAFDITSARHMPGFTEFKTAIRDHLIKNYDAKPHHGKTVPADLDYEEVYGQGYVDFKRALKTWMADCGLDLEHNPHLNSFFRHHLKIGATCQQRIADTFTTMQYAAINEVDSATLAQSVLETLQALDEQFQTEKSAKKLGSALSELANPKPKLATVPGTAFYHPPTSKEEISEDALTEDAPVVLTPRKHKESCCTLL